MQRRTYYIYPSIYLQPSTYPSIRPSISLVSISVQLYEKKIQERDDFDTVGFLLTDYCTDGFDGKQLTLAVYV